MAWTPIKLRNKAREISFIGEAEGAGGGSQLIETFALAWNTPDLAVQAFPITAVDQVAQTFTIAGDQTTLFPAGAALVVFGSTANDGNYTVASVAVVGGSTVVTTVEPLSDATPDGTLNNLGTAGFVLSTQTGYLASWIDILDADLFDGVDDGLYILQRNPGGPAAGIIQYSSNLALSDLQTDAPAQPVRLNAPLIAVLMTNTFQAAPTSTRGRATVAAMMLP